MRRSIIASLLAAVCAAIPRAAAAQNEFPFEYAVKAVCGRPDLYVVGGTYVTTVNIHNPTRSDVRFRFKVALAAPGREDSISRFRPLGLRPDGALAITCREVQEMTSRTNMDGFVVVQSPVDLDVVAVYSAAGSAGVSTMDVERVPARVPQRSTP